MVTPSTRARNSVCGGVCRAAGGRRAGSAGAHCSFALAASICARIVRSAGGASPAVGVPAQLALDLRDDTPRMETWEPAAGHAVRG